MSFNSERELRMLKMFSRAAAETSTDAAATTATTTATTSATTIETCSAAPERVFVPVHPRQSCPHPQPSQPVVVPILIRPRQICPHPNRPHL